VSSPFKRPESSYDRLAFLTAKGDRVRLLDHPTGVELERVFRCTGCGMDIAVGPCFEHIDPASYVGVVCGCLTPEPFPGTPDTVEGAGRPGPGQETPC
jgi:hypothetical protein